MEKVAVIIPALNEAGNIIHLLNEVKRVTVPGAEISVVLVDNGSSDTTSKEASEAGARVFLIFWYFSTVTAAFFHQTCRDY